MVMQRNRKIFRILWAVLFGVLFLCGCAEEQVPDEPDVHTLPDMIEGTTLHNLGSGTILYREGVLKEEEALSDAQERLLLLCMYDYYDSLGILKVLDDSYLFADELHAREHLMAAALQCAVRTLTGRDYRLDSYTFELEITSLERRDDGTVALEVSEDCRENFHCLDGLTSERYDIYHWFELQETSEGSWKIRRHLVLDTLRYVLFGDEDWNGEHAEEYISSVEESLEEIMLAYDGRIEEGNVSMERRETDHPYDREAAMQYADQYIGMRNEDWWDYGEYGGNCQNFASQCLYAGGIPMDTEGKYIWKWYGSGIANDSSRRGRSSSWTAVRHFVEYARENQGYGLCAEVGIPFSCGEAGDLLILGTPDTLRHATVIEEPLYDENGMVVDYLISCNTMNMKHYPALFYGYPQMVVIGIDGWNEKE